MATSPWRTDSTTGRAPILSARSAGFLTLLLTLLFYHLNTNRWPWDPDAPVVSEVRGLISTFVSNVASDL